MKQIPLLLATLLAMAAAQAQTTPRMTAKDKDAAEQRIEATAKSEKEACKSLKGNAQDICEAEAKAKEKVAKAELDFQASGSERDRVKLAEMKAEAAYEVAKERCEDQSGSAQATCKKEAKDREQAARADARRTAGKS